MTGKIRKFGKYLQNRLTKIFLYAIVEQFFLNFRSNFMRNFYIVILAFLLFSCVDVEKKYADYKINNEVQHFGAKRVELKKGVYVYQYDGTDDYSDFGLKGQYENEEEMTFMAWVCPAEYQMAPIICNFSMSMYIYESSRIGFEYKYRNEGEGKTLSEFVSSQAKYEKNKWILLTGVYKRGKYLKIYVNGKNDGIKTNIKNYYGFNYSFSNFLISRSGHHNGKHFFYGLIDSERVLIYNKELSEKDIYSYYKSTMNRYK